MILVTICFAIYALAALATLLAWRRERFWLWLLLAALLIVTGATRVFHVQDALTAIGRHASRSEGWYQDRRTVQTLIIICLTSAGAIAVGGALLTKRFTLRQRTAAAATLLLLTLTAARVTSLHQVDHVLTAGIGPLHIGRTIEALTLGTITTCAALSRTRR